MRYHRGWRRCDSHLPPHRLHYLVRFISMENHYNLTYCEEKREIFPTLKVRHRRHSSSLLYIHSQLFGVGSIP